MPCQYNLLFTQPGANGSDLLQALGITQVHDQASSIGVLQRATHPRFHVGCRDGRQVNELKVHILERQHAGKRQLGGIGIGSNLRVGPG
jgi:hypothetical protein